MSDRLRAVLMTCWAHTTSPRTSSIMRHCRRPLNNLPPATSTPLACVHTHTHLHTRLAALCPGRTPVWWVFSRTTRVSQYRKGKTNLDFTEARDSEWQWHQLGHMQVCTSLQTDNHASTPPLIFLQAGCPSCRPTNSVKALKAVYVIPSIFIIIIIINKTDAGQRPLYPRHNFNL